MRLVLWMIRWLGLTLGAGFGAIAILSDGQAVPPVIAGFACAGSLAVALLADIADSLRARGAGIAKERDNE